MQIKGVAVRSTLQCLEELAGKASVQAAMEKLSEGERSMFTGKIFDVRWYPQPVADKLIVETAKAIGRPVDGFSRQVGRAVAKDNFRGVYKIYATFSSAIGLLRKAPLLWKQYFDGGTMVGTSDGDTVTLVLTGHHATKSLCPAVMGWCDFAMEHYGTNGTVVHETCILRGDIECRFVITVEKPTAKK